MCSHDVTSCFRSAAKHNWILHKTDQAGIESYNSTTFSYRITIKMSGTIFQLGGASFASSTNWWASRYIKNRWAGYYIGESLAPIFRSLFFCHLNEDIKKNMSDQWLVWSPFLACWNRTLGIIPSPHARNSWRNFLKSEKVYLLSLDEAVACGAVFVIVSGSNGRTEMLLEPDK